MNARNLINDIIEQGFDYDEYTPPVYDEFYDTDYITDEYGPPVEIPESTIRIYVDNVSVFSAISSAASSEEASPVSVAMDLAKEYLATPDKEEMHEFFEVPDICEAFCSSLSDILSSEISESPDPATCALYASALVDGSVSADTILERSSLSDDEKADASESLHQMNPYGDLEGKPDMDSVYRAISDIQNDASDYGFPVPIREENIKSYLFGDSGSSLGRDEKIALMKISEVAKSAENNIDVIDGETKPEVYSDIIRISDEIGENPIDIYQAIVSDYNEIYYLRWEQPFLDECFSYFESKIDNSLSPKEIADYLLEVSSPLDDDSHVYVDALYFLGDFSGIENRGEVFNALFGSFIDQVSFDTDGSPFEAGESFFKFFNDGFGTDEVLERFFEAIDDGRTPLSIGIGLYEEKCGSLSDEDKAEFEKGMCDAGYDEDNFVWDPADFDDPVE